MIVYVYTCSSPQSQGNWESILLELEVETSGLEGPLFRCDSNMFFAIASFLWAKHEKSQHHLILGCFVGLQHETVSSDDQNDTYPSPAPSHPATIELVQKIGLHYNYMSSSIGVIFEDL